MDAGVYTDNGVFVVRFDIPTKGTLHRNVSVNINEDGICHFYGDQTHWALNWLNSFVGKCYNVNEVKPEYIEQVPGTGIRKKEFFGGIKIIPIQYRVKEGWVELNKPVIPKVIKTNLYRIHYSHKL